MSTVSAVRHGTTSRYVHQKCRCPDCLAAWSEYQARWRRGNTTRPIPAYVSHGTMNAYNNYGCRCDQCRAAIRAYKHAYRQAVALLVAAHREEFDGYLSGFEDAR